jgi:hypothetical protein
VHTMVSVKNGQHVMMLNSVFQEKGEKCRTGQLKVQWAGLPTLLHHVASTNVLHVGVRQWQTRQGDTQCLSLSLSEHHQPDLCNMFSVPFQPPCAHIC